MFYKLENNCWIGEVTNLYNLNGTDYNSEDFTEDTDLENGWIFRINPPQEYLEWRDEMNKIEETEYQEKNK